jgi:uncharacterized protein YbaR (Trm112 family)
MKPWLLDILACPIDKHFPLQLFIFAYETPPKDCNSFHQIYESRNLEAIKSENIIQLKDKDRTLYCKDLIIIKYTPLDKYLEKILASITELENIEDKSGVEVFRNSLTLATAQIRQKLQDFYKEKHSEGIDKILPELYFLNKLKIDVEIDSGLLFCEKCNRWFPIIDTLPQMLPDKYRNRQKELKFLKSKKNLLDNEFLNQDLKPFNL